MPTKGPSRYCAYAAHHGRAHGHAVEAEGFAQAAMTFVEVWHPEPDDEDGDLTVIVLDQESGEEQCFVVDLSAGWMEPCEQTAPRRFASDRD